MERAEAGRGSLRPPELDPVGVRQKPGRSARKEMQALPRDLRSVYELVWGSLAASVLYPARLRLTPLILSIPGVNSYRLRLEAAEIIERGFLKADPGAQAELLRDRLTWEQAQRVRAGAFLTAQVIGAPTHSLLPRQTPDQALNALRKNLECSAQKPASVRCDLRAREPERFRGMEIFEIKPIILGGDPLDPKNKVILNRKQHIEAVRYWNRLIHQNAQKKLLLVESKRRRIFAHQDIDDIKDLFLTVARDILEGLASPSLHGGKKSR
jgi:hypothetical protein